MTKGIKDCQRPTEAERGKEGFFPRTSSGGDPTDTLISDF